MEQFYEIDINDSFDLKHIFECGQCFRWNLNEDGSYTGVFKNNVLNVKEEKGKIRFQGICDKNIEEVVKDYFDFDTDYTKIKETLSKVDEYLEESIKFGNGIRILNQDLWEVLISFIISCGSSFLGLSDVTIIKSEYFCAAFAIKGRFVLSRLPPQPNTETKRPGFR